MHQVLSNDALSPNVVRLVVEAPRIARIRQPGQFVIVRKGPGSERIPLTIADADPGAGTIALVIQAVGKSTTELVALVSGDAIRDVAGPLGQPTELVESGHAVCVGGGVGTAVVHPIAEALHRRGVSVTSVIGGRSREWVIYEEELKRQGEVVVCTDDGSYGRHGFVTEALKDVLAAGPRGRGLRGRPRSDDARRGRDHPPPSRPHDRFAQPGDGGWDGDVRRVPRHRRRRDEVRVRRRSGVRRPPRELRRVARPPLDLP